MIVAIVEGTGEVEALPIVLRRFLDGASLWDVKVERPIRIRRNRIVKPDELEKSAELAKRQYPDASSIILVIDSDDDCPKELGPQLLARLQAVVPEWRCSVTIIKSEFEAWFIASIESLRGRRGINSNAEAPEFPEEIRNAKGWLTDRMEGSKTYLETDDQAAFSAIFDFDLAYERSRSFRKFSKDIKQILQSLSETKTLADSI